MNKQIDPTSIKSFISPCCFHKNLPINIGRCEATISPITVTTISMMFVSINWRFINRHTDPLSNPKPRYSRFMIHHIE